MRIIDDTFIIGIDSGYGNIKTANCCFPASVAAYDTEPVFKDNMLVYGNRFYLIGEGHKEFLADKTRDNDYYVLALAAIAREMMCQPRRKRLSIKAKRHIGNIVRKSGLKRMRNGSTATKSAYAGRNKPDLR